MREIRYVKGDKVLLYLQYENSEWVDEIHRQNVMVLIMDNPYNSYECVKPSEIKQGFNSLEKYNGEKIIVNSDYIIKDLLCFKDYDLLVLGCTHYPVLKSILEDNLNTKTLDMGEVLADSIKLDNNSTDKIL